MITFLEVESRPALATAAGTTEAMDHVSGNGLGWAGSTDGDAEVCLDGVDDGDVLGDGDSLGAEEGDGVEVGEGEG